MADMADKDQVVLHGKEETKVKYTCWLLLSTFIASLSSFNFGYNIAVLNTPEAKIRAFYKEQVWDVTEKEINGSMVASGAFPKGDEIWLWSGTVGIYTLCGMVGAFSSGLMAEQFGRKMGIVFNLTFAFIGTILEGISLPTNAWYLLIIGRGFIGIHCGAAVGMVSLYLTEIAPKSIRGAIGSCHQLQCTVGILVAQVLGLTEILGTETLWSILVAFSIFPALITLFVLPFCPESPRYLLLNNKDEESCKIALRKLRGREDVQDEIEEMQGELSGAGSESSSSSKFTLKQLLTAPELRLPLAIAIILQVTQQWSGINAVMMYSGQIFAEAKIAVADRPYWIVGVGIVNVLTTIVALPLLEKWGRRVLLIWPLILMSACMGLLSLAVEMSDQGSAFPVLGAICVFLYVIGFAIGLGPIPAMIVAELFRQGPRTTAMALATGVNWVCNLVLVLVFEFIKNAIGAYTFMIFMGILFACGMFIYFFVPETRNKTFDEIAQDLAFGNRYGARAEMVLLNQEERNKTNKTEENEA